MDLKTVVIISTLLLMTAGLNQTPSEPNIIKTESISSTPAISTSTSRNCSCHTAPPANTTAPNSTSSCSEPVLGLIVVNWTSTCEGNIYLSPYVSFNCSSLPVCHSQETDIPRIFENACQNKKGCENVLSWHNSDRGVIEGYTITERGAKKIFSCKTVRIKCKVEVLSDVHGPLQAYKVVTALLCCVLLVLLLIRFTRPTVKALQTRLSDRRQNRWIGPTQSHSVSYHRGKTAVKNNEGEKRLSYPALERLAISDSREPSSNRNSDYNF